MPKLKEVGGRVRYSVERFDGGYNTKDSPSKISAYETPDCLNVVFDDRGSVATRDGTAKYNSSLIGSFTVDHGISYNSAILVWANGQMWTTSSTSGATFVALTATSGKFTAGAKVGAVVYQNVLFCSDGTNGPWKYVGGEGFYNMGIDTPSAPTGASTGAGSITTGTYYYGVSFVNSAAVEGQIGSVSAGIACTSSATIRVSDVPVGSTLAGVDKRFIYRADLASGPFRKVGEISGNTTTTYDDTTANGSEGKPPVLDGSKPPVFTTIAQHKERLFMDDNANTGILRYTNFENPYISEAENEEPISRGDGEDILAVSSQDDFVTIFKENKTFTIQTTDPADDLTWVKTEIPANLGIVGPKAFVKTQNGLMFIGRQNGRLTGFHYLSGLQVIETSDGRLRTLSVSEKIEYDLLNSVTMSKWSDICLDVFENRLFMSYTRTGDTVNSHVFWLDLNRVGTEGQPGSWAPWDGFSARCFFTHNGTFYFGDATATGFVRYFNAGAYSDSGSAINSYFWTKEIGGEDDGSLDSYVKGMRELYIWREMLGNYNMNVRVRVDGDSSLGLSFPISLYSAGYTWGTMIWGVDPWGTVRTDEEIRISIGRTIGRRFQLRFDNQNTVNQAFKVHRIEAGFNIRRRT